MVLKTKKKKLLYCSEGVCGKQLEPDPILIISTARIFTVTVLKLVPGHGAARLVPLHQTSSASDATRFVFYGRSGHVRYRDRGHAVKLFIYFIFIEVRLTLDNKNI